MQFCLFPYKVKLNPDILTEKLFEEPNYPEINYQDYKIWNLSNNIRCNKPHMKKGPPGIQMCLVYLITSGQCWIQVWMGYTYLWAFKKKCFSVCALTTVENRDKQNNMAYDMNKINKFRPMLFITNAILICVWFYNCIYNTALWFL